MTIADDLVPGSTRWMSSVNQMQRLLLGVVDRPAEGNATYQLATGMGRWAELHDTLSEYAHFRLGPNEKWSVERSWELLLSVIDDATPTIDSRDFFAARVLLNLVNAPDENEPIPGTPPKHGETLAQLRTHAGVAKKSSFSQAVTVRKAYLLGLFELEAVRSFSLNQGPMPDIAATIFGVMLAEIDRIHDERAQAHLLDVPGATVMGGWGPHREMFSYKDGSPYVALNSCSDNPHIGDERCFVALRQVPIPGWEVPNVWNSDVWARKDQEYFVRIYVRNCCDTDASDGPATWAYGVRVRVFLIMERDRAAVFAVVGSDNATKIWDGATVHFDPGIIPQFVAGSAKLENNAHPNGGRILGEEIFSPSGTQIGYEQMNGILPAGFPYAGYITVRFKMVKGTVTSEGSGE
ncbi:hypothetical protein ICL81_06610 [Leucobacter sp. cx-328]|uniref:hypothetical protein n=1 Tax=unclassified Leucobacter TaxID=2621730 RepID=UPI00165E0E01|nr:MULTISPECIES: hypothetical protein [unclassified Leucobacter]MBC9944184.1 hypothetical protein [Leucobacter sp. cx-328]